MDTKGGASGNLLPPAKEKDASQITPKSKTGAKKQRRLHRPTAASSQQRMGRWLRPRGVKAGNAAVVDGICSRLIRPDELAFFANHCEMALTCWISMLRSTRVPPGTTSADPGFETAFREIDGVMGSGDITGILPRLAYMQLLCLFETLEKTVRSDHIKGRLNLRRGQGASSLAMDIYASAQETPKSRAKLLERTRFARRLREFVVASPFFLIIYTDFLETVA